MTSVPDAQEKNHKVTVDTIHVDVAIVTNFFFLKIARVKKERE